MDRWPVVIDTMHIPLAFPVRIFISDQSLKQHYIIRTIVLQHPPRSQQHKPLSEPAVMVRSINMEVMSAYIQRLFAEMGAEQKCDVLCIQETHRGRKQYDPELEACVWQQKYIVNNT